MQIDHSSTPPIAASVSEACRRLGIGKTTLYQLIATGEVRTVKIGKKTLIPEQDLRKVIDSRLQDQSVQAGAT